MKENEMKALTLLSGCMVLLLGLGVHAAAADYDLVINNGRVMDPETMFDDVANVAVKDGRIVEITKKPIEGKETIDATGHVVAPGFIDTHFHAVDPFASKMAVRDGVTTGMDFEAGAWDVKGWYEKREKSGWQINYGTTTSLGLVRMRVHDSEIEMNEPVDYSNVGGYFAKAAADGTAGWSVTRSSIEEMNQILKIMDEDLRQGALGVGAAVGYMPRGVTSYELFAAQRAGARYGRVTSVHTRYHLSQDTPTEAPIAFDEVFANAMLLGAPLLMCHNNDYGWWEIEEKLQLARAKGLNMWSEYYPYNAGNTILGADYLRPEVWRENYGFKYEETLYDPIKDEWLTDETYAARVKTEPDFNVIVVLKYRDPWLNYWLALPHMTIGSDAIAAIGDDGKLLPWDADWSEYRGHPRTAGARGKAFQLAREQGIPLMFTIAQASYWSAKHLGEAGIKAMQERGRIQVGKVADITVFDPEKIQARSSYKMGTQGLPTTGIPYVLVNGVLVVKDNEVLPVKPGQPIRFPVESQGRFEPIDKAAFLNEITIGLNPDAAWGTPIDDTGAGAVALPHLE